MPNHDKSSYAVKNSIRIATAMPRIVTGQATWKRISIFKFPTQFSLEMHYYAVTIHGEAYSHTTNTVREVEIQRIFRAHHPSIAVGFAVTNFMRDNCRAVIRDIEILKRIDK